MIKVYTFIVSPLATNCYLIHNQDTNNAFIVDPGGLSDQLSSFLEKVNVLWVINTHGHVDHISANAPVVQLTNAPLCIGEKDAHLLSDADCNGMNMLGIQGEYVNPERLLKDGEILDFDGFSVRVIETPGHTAGGISLYMEDQKILFSGDTLFKYSVGRTDLPTGDYDQLMNSIKNKLFVLPDETIVYPGHMGSTTIGEEKKENRFIL